MTLPARSESEPLGDTPALRAVSVALRRIGALPEIILGGLLVAIAILLFLQTLFRYVLHVPIGWAEEAARFGLIWLTFLGAAVCSGRGLHSRFAMVFDRSPGPLRRAMDAVSELVTLSFAGIMVVKGWDMVHRTQYERWIMLDVPVSYSYLAIPVAGVLILGLALRRLTRLGRDVTKGEDGLVAIAVLTFVAGFLVLIGTPIAFMLGASVSSGLLAEGTTDLVLIPTKMLEGIDSFVLLAIPLFILAGSLMDLGGISLRIMRFARALVGHFHGGLPMTAVVSEMLFSGISGSTMADASAIASMDIPAMRKAGYRAEYAVSVVAASAAMGVLIPPCIIMVVIGALMNVSVAGLFIGGFLPAFVLALTLFILIGYQARKHRFPREDQRVSVRQIVRTLQDSSLAMGLFLLIFGGILGGAMTPTEAAAVAVVYAAIVAVGIYREISLRRLWTIIVDAAAQSGMVLFILSVANIFSFLLSTQRVPQSTVSVISGISDSPWVFLLASLLLFVVAASFIEPLPAIIVFIPIFLPVLDRLGIDRLHYGVLVTAATGLGMFVPPVGVGLILVCAIGQVEMSTVLKYFMPFLLMLSVGLLVLVFFPAVTVFLPGLLLPSIQR
jgi:tripartite ATP-independent transporter DctM subunit